MREACLERGATALRAALDRGMVGLSEPLLGSDEVVEIQRDVGIAPESFNELFGDSEGFEHEVLSYVIRRTARTGGLAMAAQSFDEGFRMRPSQAMELGPRRTFSAGQDDEGFRLLLQLAVGGMARADLLDRCKDCLEELDDLWHAAPLVDSLGLFQLELLPPFEPREVAEMFQMLTMGALLRELISPNPLRDDLLPRAVQALFLGFTREIGQSETLRDRLDTVDARWPFDDES